MNYVEGRILTLEGTQRFRVENRGQKTVFDLNTEHLRTTVRVLKLKK